MRSIRKKLLAALIFVIVLCVGIAFAACSSGEVQKPDPVLKVQSVTLRFEGKDIEGTLNADLSLGTVQIEALVVKDEGADGTVSYKSSDSSVAEIDAGGLITLKSSGETAITAEAGGKNDNFVLIVTSSGSPAGEYTITVTGGTSNVTSADAGECVYLTPQIPADKQFSGWVWDENIEGKEGNTFVMPSANVTVSAQFVNKLAGIYIAKQPESKLVANGKTLEASDFPGLKVMAEATLGNELWDVTEEMTFALDDDNTVTATYTLGEVSKSLDLGKAEVVNSYTVDPAMYRQFAGLDTAFGAQIEGWPEGFAPVPENINDPAYDEYKQTGYLGAQANGSLVLGPLGNDDTGVITAIKEITSGAEFTYYFWSEVEGNAWLTLEVSSNQVNWTTAQADGKYICSPVLISQSFNVYLNGASQPAAIREESTARQAENPLDDAGYGCLQAHNPTVILQDMEVVRGWNSVRFVAQNNNLIRVGALTATFSADRGPDEHIWAKNTAEQYIAEPATCLHVAEYYYSCMDCGMADEENTFESGGLAPHDWGEWQVTTPATCTSPGEEIRVCNVCHEEEINVIPNGHVWGEGEAVAEGTRYTCSKCGAVAMEYSYKVDLASLAAEAGLTVWGKKVLLEDGFLQNPADINAAEYDKYKESGYIGVSSNKSGKMQLYGCSGYIIGAEDTARPEGQTQEIWVISDIYPENAGDELVYYFWSNGAGTATLSWDVQACNFAWATREDGSAFASLSGDKIISDVFEVSVNGAALDVSSVVVRGVGDGTYDVSNIFRKIVVSENISVQAGWNAISVKVINRDLNISCMQIDMHEKQVVTEGADPAQEQAAAPAISGIDLYSEANKRGDM